MYSCGSQGPLTRAHQEAGANDFFSSSSFGWMQSIVHLHACGTLFFECSRPSVAIVEHVVVTMTCLFETFGVTTAQ